MTNTAATQSLPLMFTITDSKGINKFRYTTKREWNDKQKCFDSIRYHNNSLITEAEYNMAANYFLDVELPAIKNRALELSIAERKPYHLVH